jgi:hypothetical protein
MYGNQYKVIILCIITCLGLERFDGQKYHRFLWGVPLIQEDLSTSCSQILPMSDTSLLGTIPINIFVWRLLLFFNLSRVQEANKHLVIQKFTDLDSEVETYDIKIAVNNKGKHDIRLKFVDQKPVIVTVKQDEEKLLITDILCLHRYTSLLRTHTHTYIVQWIHTHKCMIYAWIHTHITTSMM